MNNGSQSAKDTFANAMSERMRRLGYTQSDLAREVFGIQPDGTAKNRDRINTYVRGRGWPRPDTFLKICRILELNPIDFSKELPQKLCVLPEVQKPVPPVTVSPEVIYCLFSVANLYDQPDHNLVVWWKYRPSFEKVLAAIGGDMSREDSILAAAALLSNRKCVYSDTHYELQCVEEGKYLVS